MENTLLAAELKRRGMAAIEEGLKHGPIRIIKRNKSAAVVLSEAEYKRLVAARDGTTEGQTAMQWLLKQPSTAKRSKRQIDRDLRKERDW